jgi:hypothetical protein
MIADIEKTAGGFTATIQGQLTAFGTSCEVSNGRIAAAPLITSSAVPSTNYADQWWVPSEPGWGISVQKQSDLLFVDVLAYGSDGKAAWLTATATPQAGSTGHDIFAGDLYRTTGPPAWGSFDPNNVAAQRVGVLTFDATGSSQATMSYSVDGVTVERAMTRQTWSLENLTGNYSAVWTFGCGDPLWPWAFTNLKVEHGTDGAIAMTLTTWATWDEFAAGITGTYSQTGRLGELRGAIVDSRFWLPNGPITISEIERTATGFTGRLPPSTYSAPCGNEGRVAAYR